MNKQIEIPCPSDCPLRPMTHQHLQKVEGEPRKHKGKKRRQFDDGSEQNMLYKRNRPDYNKKHKR